jgi:uncharacterized membrane protein YgcG
MALARRDIVWREPGFLLLLVLVLVVLPRHATLGAASGAPTSSYRPENFPNPRLDLAECGRGGVASRVCDPGGLLGASHANTVEEFIKTVQRDTESGCGGFQLAVAVAPRIDADWPTATTPRDKAARAFAMSLHDAWGVGDRECQNGILVFISKGDRKVFISTGSGAKMSLPPKAIAGVIEKMRSYLRRDDFGGAAEVAVNAIAYELQHAGDGGGWWGTLETVAGWLVPLSILYLFFRKPDASEYDTARLRAQRLDRERALARSAAFEQVSCPICLEEFATPTAQPAEAEAEAAQPPPQQPMEQAAEPQDRQQQRRRPELLRCGHKFCRDCLEEWLARKNTCPICRQDAVRVGAAERCGENDRGGQANGSDSSSSDPSGDPSGDSRGSPGGAGESKEDSADTMGNATSSSSASNDTPPGHKTPRWDAAQNARDSGNGTTVRHTTVRHFDPYSDQEWMFRVQSLRRLHPTYVTETMESRWSNPTFQGMLAEDTEFIQSSPSYTSFEGTGSSGYSSFDGGDFGGGSSSGGGGGGW